MVFPVLHTRPHWPRLFPRGGRPRVIRPKHDVDHPAHRAAKLRISTVIPLLLLCVSQGMLGGGLHLYIFRSSGNTVLNGVANNLHVLLTGFIVTDESHTLTEVFPRFFLSCRANARV